MVLQTLNVQLSGLPPAPNTPVLFFLSGFPDSHKSFDTLAPHFAQTHTLATAVMPDMEITSRSLGGGGLTHKWGYSFPEVVDAAAASCKELLPASRKVTFVGHDWGAFVALLMVDRYPELFNGMVCLDVGMFSPLECTPLQVAVIATYQTWLALAFLISQLFKGLGGQSIGDLMCAFFPWKWVGPTPYEYKIPRNIREIHCWMCYPYFRLIGAGLLGKLPTPAFPPDKGVPLLYVFGQKKRVFFHTSSFLKNIDREEGRGGTAYRMLEQCGHWVQTQGAGEVASDMARFLEGKK